MEGLRFTSQWGSRCRRRLLSDQQLDEAVEAGKAKQSS
jgi:hypothetical protein